MATTKIELARVRVVSCATGIGSFVASFLSGIMAIKFVSLILEAGSAMENPPVARRLDYALKKIVVDVLPGTVHYIEQFLPSIIVPGHDEDWPILMRYPIFGGVSTFLIVLLLYLALSGFRIVMEAVKHRNEAEAERSKASIAGC